MDVHAGTALRIGTAERHLQRGEMHDVRDPVVVERRAEGCSVGHVSRDERDQRPLLLGQDEPHACVVRSEIEADRLLAELDERLERPRAEAAERAGDERAASVRQAVRPGRR